MTLGNASAGAQPEANGEPSLPTSMQKDQHAKEPKLYSFETVRDMLYAPHSWD